MHFPSQPDGAVIDAIVAMRNCMAAHLPAGPGREEAEALFDRIEESALLGVTLQMAGPDDRCEAAFLAEPVGADFRWTYVNSAFMGLNGLAGCSLAGELMSERLEMARFQVRCREAVTSRAPQDYEERVERADCLLELQFRIAPLFDSAGRCYRVAGVSRDVTDQKLAERQLRKQNRRLQNILGSISDGFLVVDRDWNITFMNARAEQLLSCPREQLAGSSLFELFPEIQAEKLRAPAELRCGSPAPTQTGQALDSPQGWLLARAYPSQDGTAIYLQDISERKQAECALRQGIARMQASLDGVVNAMAYTVEMRDPYTGGHQRRVSALACAIARELGYTTAQIETMRIAGLLHDIGKISIPAEILNRPGRLSEPERIIIRTHAQIGYEILNQVEFEAPVALIALQHHERLDGSGYPQGLYGTTIIPEARILAIADVVEAMASHRPYRAALGVEAALKEIITNRGVHYDDVAVGACLSVFTESGFDFDVMMQTELTRRAGSRNPPELRHDT